MKTISLKFPPRLEALVIEESRRRQVSKSAVIRACVERVLQETASGSTVSCYDLAQDLAGYLRGPRDLATNPKYLEGFGE
jgi:hypothetical protein